MDVTIRKIENGYLVVSNDDEKQTYYKSLKGAQDKIRKELTQKQGEARTGFVVDRKGGK